MGGRKPLPKGVTRLRGTEKKCRKVDSVELSGVIKIPPAPRWMTFTGKKIYKDVTRELAAKGLLQSVGLPLVVSYCNLMAQHLRAEEQLLGRGIIEGENPDLKGGKIVETFTKSGKILMVHPLHRVSMDALEKAVRIASEFGLTLSSQARIAAPFQGGKKDPSDNDFTR